jgi:hypothetical protein
MMAFGIDLDTLPFKKEREESSPEPEPEIDRFEECKNFCVTSTFGL